VTDALPQAVRRAVELIVDAILLFLALALLVLCWQWYDPIAVIAAGFDLAVFAQNTFKFIYTEPTSTLGIPKFWVWLVVPFMASAMTIHALANLLEGPRAQAPGADLGASAASGA
jgi:TRAP-type C4-dicarboxylate transport system permease small subunit